MVGSPPAEPAIPAPRVREHDPEHDEGVSRVGFSSVEVALLSQVRSAAVNGVESVPVRVEVDVGPGVPSFSVVGLAAGAVREGRDRVRAALLNSGFGFPPRRVTVNLAPANVRKEGSGLDLPLALGLLAALEQVPAEALRGGVFLGELGLDGELRPVRGVLPVARRCAREGVRTLVVPERNGAEAAAANPGLRVLAAPSLAAVVKHLRGCSRLPREPPPADVDAPPATPTGGDLREVRGHETLKRALEVAAAGAHNLLMLGPPGSGKTMLARRLPGILPPLRREDALDVTAIHSVAGLLPDDVGVLRERPFRAPHHTVSRAGMAGGGTPVRPGEISLAHHGVLFLDELPEFPRSTLETLRQPLESGYVGIVRARERTSFPASFMLVAAMNPCPCGFLGDDGRPCTCDPALVARYRGRVSGPLRDRIDLHLEVRSIPFDELQGPGRGDTSADVRERVVRARRVQEERFGRGGAAAVNGRMEARHVQTHGRPTPAGRDLLQRAARYAGLSSRGIHRVLKVARTIADLDGVGRVERRHVAEAIQYRVLDRPLRTMPSDQLD